MDQEAIQREDDQLIINDVARAVEEREFVPYVQPLFDLKTNKVVGAEVLARWTLPEDGTVVPAAAFIPSLERTNTICGLDWYIADAVCVFLGEAQGAVAHLPVALNISSQHTADPDFAKRLASTADWHHIDHALLGVELGTNLMEDEDVKGALAPSIMSAGFGVIADNFAAGASELRELAEGGVRAVKIAGSLWRGANAGDLQGIVAAAKKLGLVLVAENVENDEERAIVKAAGITWAQGYGLAHPMSLEEYVALLEK